MRRRTRAELTEEREQRLRADPALGPEFWLVRDGSVEDVQRYVEGNPNPDRWYESQNKSLFEIVISTGSVDKCRYFVEAGVEMKPTDGRSPISVAATCGHLEVLHYLVGLAAKNLAPADLQVGLTGPLWYAVGRGHTAVVDYLLSLGADPNNADRPGDLRAIDWANSPEQNFKCFKRVYPLTDPSYKKAARRKIEYIGFEQSIHRADMRQDEERTARLVALWIEYCDFIRDQHQRLKNYPDPDFLPGWYYNRFLVAEHEATGRWKPAGCE